MKKTILYAEDHPDLREIVLKLLIEDFPDYNFETFERGDLLEERVERGVNGVCAIVTDNRMPYINGLDIIKKFAPRLKVPIILHYFGELEIGVAAVKYGAYAYVLKDEINDLTDILRRAINESTTSSQ